MYASSSRQICSRTGCNKSVYIEASGFAHPYCGKTCAFYIIKNLPSISRCQNPTCSRQKFVDSRGIQYNYCGKSCARQHSNPKALFCSRPNCNKRVYTDPNDKNKFYSYCTSTCYWLECSTLTYTKLSLLIKEDLDYIQAYKRFISMLPNAKIKGIIRLQMPKKLVEAHQMHKKQMANQSGLSLNVITHNMYHGTKSLCDPLQYIQTLSPRCSNSCGLCGIVSSGNDTAYSRNSGQMWFANSPSISFGYCGNYSGNSSTKVIFMVDVLSKNANSILIVSKNSATLPRFLIIFQ
ncbi:hypothetical protein C1645_818115 [Glomus cerebriforme]|uniref:PARP catalytic domain-containing protein n=1 Tax=Glomus cerebriforme TaxID=658196 RepID=A0A397THP4_9GLOM|nr:hypothetical protein C1645_818115 [Glomus cerebriforme]